MCFGIKLNEKVYLHGHMSSRDYNSQSVESGTCDSYEPRAGIIKKLKTSLNNTAVRKLDELSGVRETVKEALIISKRRLL